MNQRQPTEFLADLAQQPFAVQQHGFLIVLDSRWNIMGASENIGAFLSLEWNELIGGSVQSIIPQEVLHAIKNGLQLAAPTSAVAYQFAALLAPELPYFDVAAHIAGSEIVLEFEPATPRNSNTPTLRWMLGRLRTRHTAVSVCQEAVRQIRSISGFDRVVLYALRDGEAGDVVAETAKYGLSGTTKGSGGQIPISCERLKPFFLYDVTAPPVTVQPEHIHGILNRSQSLLRNIGSAAEMHLDSTFVRSILSMPVCQGEKPWGLAVSSHSQPKYISMEIRATIELFCQMFGYVLESRMHAAHPH